MADAKLTALTAASALAAADLFYVSQSAASRKATGTQLLALVGTAYVPLAGGTMTGALTIASGTLTASAPALNITQTWNNAGVTFVGGYMDITNPTTSSATSTMYEWRVGGVMKANITRDGNLYTPILGLGTGANGYWSADYFQMRSNTSFGWSATTVATATHDIDLYRDAAGIIGQRASTTAQAYRIYGTYTDSSNYERLSLSTTAGSSVNISAETLGTGGDNLDIVLTPAGMGSVYLPIGATATPGVRFVGTNAGLWYSGTFTVLRGQNAAINDFVVGNAVFRMNSTEVFGWASGDAVATAHDIALRRSAAGVLDVDSGSAGAYRDLKARNTIMPAVAFASLVAAATAGAGARSTINNCSTAVFNAAADGAGALTVPVWSNGTSWLVG